MVKPSKKAKKIAHSKSSAQLKKSAASKKGTSSKKTVLCENCGRSFSKTANLNSHIEKVHKGLRWRCHICGQHQASKHSHMRHYQSQHDNQLPANIDLNQRYAHSFVDLPPQAKDSMIKDLKDKVEVQEVLLKSFRKRLMARLKENIVLKCRLGMDCEIEKLEYNTLCGSGDDSEVSVSTGNDSSSEKEGSYDDDDDDDDKVDQSSHYPDAHPLTISPISDDVGAGSSSM